MAHDYFRALRDVALVINSSLEPRSFAQNLADRSHRGLEPTPSACSTARAAHCSAAHGLSTTYMRKGPVE